MEQNRNAFATAEAAWSPRSTHSNLPSPVPEPVPFAFEPVARAARFDGWTPERQRGFIEELADCGLVREAAARVGMSERSAYRLRRCHSAEAFNLAWEAAVQIGVDRLRSVAYERAVTGTPKPIYYRGEKVGEERVYSDRLLIYLLSREQKPPNSGLAHLAIPEWDRWMEAVEAGVPRPMQVPDETTSSPVWIDGDGDWWTTFDPPEDYRGQELGTLGEPDYRRELSPEEVECVEAWTESSKQEKARRRDEYFARLKSNFLPPPAA